MGILGLMMFPASSQIPAPSPKNTSFPTFQGSQSSSSQPVVTVSPSPSHSIPLASLIVISPQFDFTWNFADGLAAVEINGKWGYIRNPLK